MYPHSRRLFVLFGFLSLLGGGCGGGTRVTDGGLDAGPDTGVDGGMDGSDVCAGLTLCATAGASCSGETLLTCAANADGCLVQTSDDCTAMGGSCDDSGATAVCASDPCADVPAADQCAADGDRECSGDTLRMCAADAAGCFVFTDTNCAAAAGGTCDDTGAMPMCVMPVDPCEGLADACATAGTSCTGDSLVTCAPNAFGCLVATTDDCTARASGTCDASATPAACTFTGDPCAGVTQCDTLGAVCSGPELVTCAPDAFGCNVETRSDCTAEAFGFCDTMTAPNRCSTAATDPCLGMTTCTPAAPSCDGDTRVTCAPNAFGCNVEARTDCTATSQICGDLGGVSQCGNICDFRATCSSATYCDGMDAVTCTADADGCLVEDARTTCDAGLACTAGACAPAGCPAAAPIIIDCATGSITGNTADGNTDVTNYPDCTSLSYPNNGQIFVFQNATRALVDITSTRLTGTHDYDLFVLDGTSGDSCTAASCIDGSTGSSATESVSFDAAAGGTYFVAYDLYGSTAETTDYSLDITCTPVVCGDGIVVSGAESCDDGGTDPGDGCSATCTVEPSYGCTGTPSICAPLCGNGVVDSGEGCDDGGTGAGDGCSATCTVESGYVCSGSPSVCSLPAANATCAGATAITSDTTITGEDISLGGPRPSGTGCGTSSGNSALYYAVTLPANTVVDVATTGTFDRVLLTEDICGAAACSYRTDSSPEGTTLMNTTGSPITRIVVIHNYSSTGTGTYDIRFTYGAATASNSTCAGATAITTDTSITGENIVTGGPRPTGTGCGTSSGDNALYYAVTLPANTSVSVATTGTFDRVLLTEDTCGAAACSYRTDTSPEGTTLMNTTGSPITRIVVIHNYSSTGSGTFDISFTYGSFAANATCAGATAITSDTTITGEDISLGGPRPSGTGCGSSSGNSALYYAVTLPANTVVDVATTGTLDRVLLTEDTCGAAACSYRTDTAPEGTTLMNTTASPVTRIVAIHNYSSTGTGTFDISFTYRAGPTVISETEPNEDGTPSTGGSGIAGNDVDATAITNADANGAITSDTLINAALSPAGDEDVFAIHNTTGAPVTVTIETGNPTAGVCSADTGLRLLASDLSVVTTDDDGGPGACSRIVWTIPAGVTYYAHVVEYGDNATIDPYQLTIDFP